MAGHVCPPLVGYLLLNPLRKLAENPKKIFGAYVQEGMTVLEPGCAMGFFTLPLARMVGPQGRVVAVDVQTKMLSALTRRAERAGLLDRIETRQAQSGRLGLEDLAGQVDLALALHMVHEVSDQDGFLAEVHQALKPGAKFLIVEPKGHVSADKMAKTVDRAKSLGFTAEGRLNFKRRRSVLLTKP